MEQDKIYSWVKAKDRLPENAGESNYVALKLTFPDGRVRYARGFKNYSEKASLYFIFGNKSYLTVDGEGDNNSTFCVDFVEWLEEQTDKAVTTKPFNLNETRKLLNELLSEDISMSRFVEILNEKATGLDAKELQNIPFA